MFIFGSTQDDFFAEVDKKDHVDIKDQIQSFKEVRNRFVTATLIK
jgi:hypothetical protein